MCTCMCILNKKYKREYCVKQNLLRREPALHFAEEQKKAMERRKEELAKWIEGEALRLKTLIQETDRSSRCSLLTYLYTSTPLYLAPSTTDKTHGTHITPFPASFPANDPPPCAD